MITSTQTCFRVARGIDENRRCLWTIIIVARSILSTIVAASWRHCYRCRWNRTKETAEANVTSIASIITTVTNGTTGMIPSTVRLGGDSSGRVVECDIRTGE